MKLIQVKLSKAVTNLIRLRPERDNINNFKVCLRNLIDKINVAEQRAKDESEEHLKNDIRDFLRDSFYKDTNAINTKEKADLAIYKDKSIDSNVCVIIEAKRPKNKGEMLSLDNPNKKAFHELVLYYMRERVKGNNDIQYLIATNINEWYIFEAKYFEKNFYVPYFIKQYNEWDKKMKVTSNTELFYNGIAKSYIDNIEDEIPCICFDVRDYEKTIKQDSSNDDAKLLTLYKILSPYFLLRKEFADDSNELDLNFYKELLHIIGLEDVKEGGRNIIQRKRNAGSLIELTIDELQTDGIYKVANLSSHGVTSEEKHFNIALELCITWVNRILFLKLLEGQLKNFHNDGQDYSILNIDRVNDFDKVFKLFHKVLAVSYKDRSEAIQKEYKDVPYLNSSLFDFSELEEVTIKINSLDDGAEELQLISTTILKAQKKSVNKLPVLEYLFRFLDAYDFSADTKEDIKEKNKKLITASVLGKVFEKINGYKDGSIYTPSFITMYMSEQSIRLAVVHKFNEVCKWECNNFDELKDRIDTTYLEKGDRIKYNEIVNSIKICDPAVGSGHFLVSALNELIKIKGELKILSYKDWSRVKEWEIKLDNDELIIIDIEEGSHYSYSLNQKNNKIDKLQKLQEALFYEKQTLIENCLFGVDINQKSVMICRLRLWIELLKNAYYKSDTDYTELETLPNIDINIKCGNSLISRFYLDDDLSKALKSIKYNIEQYKGFVLDYKKARTAGEKRGLQKIIDTIKSDFRTEINKNDPKRYKLSKANGELFNLENQIALFDEDEKQKKTKLGRKKILESEIKKLSTEIKEIENNVIYKDAFEWRFEFPEVLKDNGDFEGFDLIIGNPPYGVSINTKDNVEYSKQYKDILSGELETYILFYYLGLKVINKSGLLSYITPDSWLTNKAASNYRQWLQGKCDIIDVFDYYKPFSEAKDTRCHSVLFGAYNGHKLIKVRQTLPSKLVVYREYDVPQKIIKEYGYKEWRLYISSKERGIFHKIESIGIPLENLFKIKYGLRTGDNNKYISNQPSDYPIIAGSDIAELYLIKWKEKYLKSTEGLPISYFDKNFSSKKIIIQYVRTNSININARWLECAYVEGNYIPLNSLSYIYIDEEQEESHSLKYCLALLNSRLINKYYRACYTDVNVKPTYLAQLPIPKISLIQQKPFIDLVDKIISGKQQGNNTTDLEREIDCMVYALYELTAEEITLIE